MRFLTTPLSGVIVVAPELLQDDRGFFARTWCEQEAIARGLQPRFVQTSISFNRRRGTLRGMHFQLAPHSETKLVRCTRGRVYDVVVDIRPGSPTYGKWTAVELSADNRMTLYIPEGFAQGFETLEDDSELLYQMSCPYMPEAARGFRWNDPLVAIDWPIAEPILSARDAAAPALDEFRATS